jgi:hypothetical protein
MGASRRGAMSRLRFTRRTVSLVIGAALLTGCGPATSPKNGGDDPSLRDLSYPFLEGSRFFVENGRAYDKATVELGSHTVLVVPGDARVGQGAPEGRVELYMEKEMGDDSRVEYRSIRDIRKRMGCVSRKDGQTLLIATYGYYEHKHGGASLNLLVKVPAGLRVEKRNSLSSLQGGGKEAPARPKGPSTLGPGWEPIPDTPDPAATARQMD